MIMTTDEVNDILEAKDPSPEADKNEAADKTSSQAVEHEEVAVAADTEHDEPEVKSEQKKEYTPKEKRDYAFIREKSKRKALREKYEKQIAEMQAELDKYKGLTLKDFKDDTQKYIDYSLDRRDAQRNIADQERELERLSNEEAVAENARRMELSFPNEQEREEFQDLLNRRGQEFMDALEQYDPEHVVLNYLNDMEQYPIVLKRLMTDQDALRSVFSRRDPMFRKIALDRLATRMTQPKRKALPVIGRQTTSAQSAETSVRDNNYWNDWLMKNRKG